MQAVVRTLKKSCGPRKPRVPVAPPAELMPLEDDAGLGEQPTDLLMDKAVDGDPISLWREDNETQVMETRAWLCSDGMQDEVTMFAVINRSQEKMMKRDLAMSTRGWEMRQREQLIKEGHRTYPILEAHDATAGRVEAVRVSATG